MKWVILLHFVYTSYGNTLLIFRKKVHFFEKYLGFTIDFFRFFFIIYIDNDSKYHKLCLLYQKNVLLKNQIIMRLEK